MSRIRMIAKVDGGRAAPALQAAAGIARGLEGCLQAETFQSVERPSALLYVELWETPAAWDAAWVVRRAQLEPALTVAEFYKQARFAPTGPAWIAVDPDARAQTIRWPANGAIRILIQVAATPSEPTAFIQNAVETRAEPGCLEFEFFRSLDFPENVALIEGWASPAIYDVHWRLRIAQAAPPPPPPPERRYGETSFEWYPRCRYRLADDVWVPAAEEQRMETVLW